MKERKSFTTTLDKETLKWLRVEAAKRDVKINDLIEEIIEHISKNGEYKINNTSQK